MVLNTDPLVGPELGGGQVVAPAMHEAEQQDDDDERTQEHAAAGREISDEDRLADADHDEIVTAIEEVQEEADEGQESEEEEEEEGNPLNPNMNVADEIILIPPEDVSEVHDAWVVHGAWAVQVAEQLDQEGLPDHEQVATELGESGNKPDEERSTNAVMQTVGASVAGAAFTTCSTSLLAGTLGYTTAGIEAASWAARIMSTEAVIWGGAVPAGGFTSIMQTVGAAGVMASPAAIPLLATGAIIGCGGLVAYRNKRGHGGPEA